LVDGEYRPVAPLRGGGFMSEVLRLELHRRGKELRFFDPATQSWIRTMEEEVERADAAQAQAEAAQAQAEAAQALASAAQAQANAAQARVDAERMRAETAETELARLRAELARLRGQG
jgi:hypothetical protein